MPDCRLQATHPPVCLPFALLADLTFHNLISDSLDGKYSRSCRARLLAPGFPAPFLQPGCDVTVMQSSFDCRPRCRVPAGVKKETTRNLNALNGRMQAEKSIPLAAQNDRLSAPRRYGITNWCVLGRTVNTGQGALRTTRSATLPSSTWANPPRPWVPSTIRSLSVSFA